MPQIKKISNYMIHDTAVTITVKVGFMVKVWNKAPDQIEYTVI